MDAGDSRGWPPGRPTTWLQVSAYRFLVRRLECALLRGGLDPADGRPRASAVSLAAGCVLSVVVLVGCVISALLRPQVGLGDAQIVVGRESGALYVRVGDTWHPVLNLASARLIAGTGANPKPVREAEVIRVKRGPLLGIPGAPQFVGQSLPVQESAWTICDTDRGAATTLLVGRPAQQSVRRLVAEQTILVATESGSPAYLLYDGHRAVVDLADPAVRRALRLEGRTPYRVSRSLLSAVPEVPPISVLRIGHAGEPALAGKLGFSVGTVLSITAGGGAAYYVVLAQGVQRIGQVAADLLRFSDSQGAANAIAVAPDVIRAAPIVETLPVTGYPDTVSEPLDAGVTTLCLSWVSRHASRPDVAFLAGDGLPVPAGARALPLVQADGRGPALDAVYLPPGRSAYVTSRGLSGSGAPLGRRYLVTDAGVRYLIHDEDTARHLGLLTPTAAPWPMLATLPEGPELSGASASVAYDVVAVDPPVPAPGPATEYPGGQCPQQPHQADR
ncbi:type VII secretion protein EccB [Mycobacterium ulcerans]|uniref:type VII secretion protein EccB n=1 Tax=Mycobacterium ulcerans TaxID=1809 RepID=UPI0008F80077|nr:type VII secretion protein EccB [Mycobacterium ulcerans]MEB3903940.1 type VII secretion protein EccB [Mycobacterium ulcerans]MEB3908031.1 type VII secretion protein EccB [Mycobacterium ulcerans]MEB3918379.1 type VII secretion protein EccB [Mycobacterium ulcerans]MEB3922460.1 type VII secretion protein EccB [Mycobacterium ulcerans]MEB3926642.1 type VII secretion protein EccB [Mycobacterium ulcerans]